MQLALDTFHAERARVFQTGPVPPFALEDVAVQIRQAPRPSVCEMLTCAPGLLIQPRCGVGEHMDMLHLLTLLEDSGGADILTVTIDSYTRLNRYAQAAESLQQQRPLNGYPLITHGITRGRELVQAVSCPLQVRHGSPDGRLLAEVTYAAGITAFEGGGVCYNLPYCKAVPLRQSLRAWQYVDRLTGLLSDHPPIDRETFGPLTSVLMPPSISIAISILEMLLAVEQGVRCVTIGFPETGNVLQDVAALRVIPTLCQKYLRSMGVSSTPLLFTSFHQWMGVFPENQAQALALMAAGVVTAVLGHATKLINKTFQEAQGIPTPEANAFSIRFCKELIRYGAGWSALYVNQERLEEECYWLTQEVDTLLDAVGNLGTENLVEAIVRAFTTGQLDIPFPANPEARGAVMPARARDGSIRYRDMGHLPFNKAIRAFHQQRLASKDSEGLNSLVEAIYFMARESIPRFRSVPPRDPPTREMRTGRAEKF